MAAFVLLVPEWLKSVVVMMLPVYVLNYFFSFPLEWLGIIVLRVLFEMTDVRLGRLAGRFLALLAVIFAWLYLIPARASPLLLSILIHTYIIRQSCAFNDQPQPNRRMPSKFRLSTFFYWLLIISFDTFVRNISTSYPRYAAIAAGFTVLGNFDIVDPPPEPSAPPADGAATKARPGPSGRRRRGG